MKLFDGTGRETPDETPLPTSHGLLHLLVIQELNWWAIAVTCNTDYTAIYASHSVDSPPS